VARGGDVNDKKREPRIKVRRGFAVKFKSVLGGGERVLNTGVKKRRGGSPKNIRQADLICVARKEVRSK